MDAKILHELFEYRDGELYWKVPRKKIRVGSIAGCITKEGYRRIKFFGKSVLAHRIVFFMFNGYLPEAIDHIDRNPLNNRIENLREANPSQNKFNMKTRCNNTSGFKNVGWVEESKKWRVTIGYNGNKKHIGMYDSLEKAKEAADLARSTYHGKFANHG